MVKASSSCIREISLVCAISLDSETVQAVPLVHYTPLTQEVIRFGFAEVWIAHQDEAGRQFCLCCFVLGKAPGEDAAAQAVVLQRQAAVLVATFNEYAVELEDSVSEQGN